MTRDEFLMSGMVEFHTINGVEFRFRHVPAWTPRQTGFNGGKRRAAYVAVGAADRWEDGRNMRWQFPSVADAREWIAANAKDERA